jgi:hypothetical protein
LSAELDQSIPDDQPRLRAVEQGND